MKIPKSFAKLTLIAALAGAVTLIMLGNTIASARAASLSTAEAEMLTYMREEEKMAHDVYVIMYQKWGAAIFSNIVSSEQRHMDTMKKMLDKYRLPDPAQTKIGIFTNSALQEQHDELLAFGSQSYINGLYAGATIEEIDMIDIQHAIDGTTRLDLKTVYQNLLEGSKNHLRAFVSGLEAQGVTYTPQFISQDLYDAIIGL
jgi:hypothetical protein